MKKFIMCITMLLTATAVTAQNQVGTFSVKPMAGLNISNFGSSSFDIYKTRYGFIGGAEIEYGVSPWLGLSLGMVYSQQGAKMDGTVYLMDIDEAGYTLYSESDFNGNLKCDYLNLPLMANIYIPAVKGLALKAGVQMGILTSDKMEASVLTCISHFNHSNNIQVFDAMQQAGIVEVLGTQVSQTDVCKAIDFGIPVGLSYEFKNVSLDARYYFGLTKVDKTENPDNSRNRFLSITLGYRFHL